MVTELVSYLLPKSSTGVLIGLSVPVVLQATVFRKRGSYEYRLFITMLCICISATFGSIVPLLFSLFGKRREGLCYHHPFQLFLLRAFLGIEFEIEDKENVLKPNSNLPTAVYVNNHQTFFDMQILSAVLPEKTSLVAKKEFMYYPILNLYLIMTDGIFMDRKNRGNALKIAGQIVRDMKRLDRSVFIYPEGTRSGGHTVDLLPFKKGAFHIAIQAKVPIVPIVTANYNHIYDSRKKHFGHGVIKIKVMPAISTENTMETSESIGKLVDTTRSSMLATLVEISYRS